VGPKGTTLNKRNKIMAYRKNVKRIDPRYFLDETVNRGEEPPETTKDKSEETSDPRATEERK
jgi:hypothetical protein